VKNPLKKYDEKKNQFSEDTCTLSIDTLLVYFNVVGGGVGV
jgi:hypothetical protein